MCAHVLGRSCRDGHLSSTRVFFPTLNSTVCTICQAGVGNEIKSLPYTASILINFLVVSVVRIQLALVVSLDNWETSPEGAIKIIARGSVVFLF